MKKFFISFVLIISLLFNVFADNKQAHKELREAFENYGLLPELIEKGFSLDKLDEIDDPVEMRDYLQPFFMDENGMPLDNHACFCIDINGDENYSDASVNTTNSLKINFSDEYGSKDELLKKGYKEDEIFYYPYFNGEWRDGYRVGKKYMGSDQPYEFFNESFIVENENTLYCGLCSFYEGENDIYYDKIKSSKKKYLVLDISGNSGGRDTSYFALENAIKKMKPKKIFIIINQGTFSMGEICPILIKRNLNIDTTIIGRPSYGGYQGVQNLLTKLNFDDFVVLYSLGGIKWVSNTIEGIGVTPNIYSSSHEESMEIIKKLTGDNVKFPKEIFVYDYF